MSVRRAGWWRTCSVSPRGLREALEGGPDDFGEEHVLDLRLHLLEAGLDDPKVLEVILTLTVTNNALDPAVANDTQAAACEPEPAASTSSDSDGDSSGTSLVPTELASGDEEVPPEHAPPPPLDLDEPVAQAEAEHLTAPRPDGARLSETDLLEAAGLHAACPPPTAGFVLSIMRRAYSA